MEKITLTEAVNHWREKIRPQLPAEGLVDFTNSKWVISGGHPHLFGKKSCCHFFRYKGKVVAKKGAIH